MSAGPPVTRLSRKVLLGLGAAAALGIGGALFLALKPQHRTAGSELYDTNNRNTPDGLATLPKDYTGLPQIDAAARAAAARRSRPADPERGRARARHADADRGIQPGRTAHRAGAGSGASEPSLRDDQCRSNRCRAFAASSSRSAYGGRDNRAIKRPHVPGSQARLPERACRSAHSEPRSHRAAGKPLCAASWRGHPGLAHHRAALRPAWPSDRPGDGRRL